MSPWSRQGRLRVIQGNSLTFRNVRCSCLGRSSAYFRDVQERPFRSVTLSLQKLQLGGV
jgi:hypothetical protein